jgi:hypothetical protein
MPQEICGLPLSRTTDSDSGAGGSKYLLCLESKRSPQFLCNPFCNSSCITYTGNAFKQEGEFISAETRNGIYRPQASFQTFGDCYE